jgi:hypothetical protein
MLTKFAPILSWSPSKELLYPGSRSRMADELLEIKESEQQKKVTTPARGLPQTPDTPSTTFTKP